MGRLGLLYPYLPDRSRLGRGVISALGCFLFSYFYYKGGCQVLVGILSNAAAISGTKPALEATVESRPSESEGGNLGWG